MFGQNNGGYDYNQNGFLNNNPTNNQQQYSQNFVNYNNNSYGYDNNQSTQFNNNTQNNFIQDQNVSNNNPFFNQQQTNENYNNNNNYQQNTNTQYNSNYQNNYTDQNSENATSQYTAFENLPNYGENVNVSEVIESMKVCFEDKNNWKSIFDAIDNLRILNKYYSKDINDIINLFWLPIKNCLESQKTSILKNILVFIKEVFSFTAKEVRLRDEVISGVIPILLKHSTTEKKLLKAEIVGIIEEFVTHCCFDESVIVLCNYCFDKNPTVCEASFFTLGKMIQNIGENLPGLTQNSLQAIMVTLAKTLDNSKKGNVKKWAQMVCQNLCNLFGIQNYYGLIESTMSGQSVDLAQLLVKAVEDKKNVSRESGFHDFVLEKKKEARMSMYNNYSNNNNNYQNQYENTQQKMNSQNILGQYDTNNMNFQNNGGYNNNQYPLNFPQQF